MMKSKLKPYLKYKPSGVDTLGEVPEHWDLIRLRFLGRLFAGLTGKKGSDFSKVPKVGFAPFVPFTSICNYRFLKDEIFQYVNIGIGEPQNELAQGDLMFLMSSETSKDIGLCSIFSLDIKKVYLNSFCKAFRITQRDLSPHFATYLLNSDSCRYYFSSKGRGFTRVNIKSAYVKDIEVVLPPPPRTNRYCQFPR